jgi:RNA polymerase sigma factor (sigma-70 family)
MVKYGTSSGLTGFAVDTMTAGEFAEAEMTEDDSFVALLGRIQAGDTAAEQILFLKYDGPIRRAARMRFMHSRMQRLMDSEDIRQSVMRSFFQRMRGGALNVATPGHLVALLMEMTRNKVTDQVRRLTAVRRGGDEQIDSIDAALGHAIDDEGPEDQVIRQEISQIVDECLSDEERKLIRLRKEGLDWKAIGEQCAASPEATRKRYERMVARITSEMGLEEGS